MKKAILLLAIISGLFLAVAEQCETIKGLDWYYELNAAGTGASLVRVEGYNKETTVTLPSGVGTYGRIPVIAIASNFYWNATAALSYPKDRVEYLIIPDSVRDIGMYAFSDSYMPRVNLGGTTNIADYAFFCSSLGSVSFGSGLLRVGYKAFSVSKVSSINFDYHAPLSLASQAFMNCEHLKSLTLPYALKFDGSECFSRCTALESVSTVYGLKAIGRGAFKGCSRLKSVSITGSVGEIASEAFSGCAVLTSVQFGTFGVVTTNIASSAFSGCSNLQDIDIPSAVENIGSDAFCDCLHLTNVVLRAGLKNIGVRAFSGCNSLTSIYIPSTVETIGAHAFVEQYSTLAGWKYRCHLKTVYCDPGDQDRVKNLIVDATAGATVPVVPFRKYATIDGFTWAYVPSSEGCEISEQFTTPAISTDAAGEVVVPVAIDGRSVSAIGDYAFNGCKNITSLILPNGVETIGQYAFSDCAELSILTLPCVTSIALTAFEGCNNLAEIRITTPCNLREFKDAIAKCGLDCSRIKFVVLNHSIDDQVAISYLSYHGEVTIQGLGDVNVSAVPPDVCGALDIPAELSGEPVVEIGDFAFYGCSNLTSVSMPTSVRRIGNKAFYGCGSIDEFKMPNQDVSIGRQAFEFTGLWNSSPEGCVVIDGIFVGIKGDSVDEIMIPNGVARINDAALFSCSNIVTIGMPDSICEIQSNAFVDCSKWTVVKVSYEHADRILGLVRASGQNTELLSVVYTTLPPPIITPADGSIFDLKTKVVISNIVTDATIYYTTDGSDPTVNSMVYSKFNATSKITIKAIAVLNGYLSPVATATIAPGKVAAPVLSSDCEGVFVGQTKVTMTCATADAEIYYTLDGSVPTRDAARYSGEIILNDSCMVRAIAVNSEWLDSDEKSLILRRKSSAPTIIAESEFMGCEERVRIVSPDVGAKIYYTIDGSIPTVENGILYSGEFSVDASVTVRAIAIADEGVSSEAVAFEIKQLTPASGEGNWVKSFNVEFDECWSRAAYVNYEVGGNPSANSTTGYLYVVYKGVTNRAYSAVINAGAGEHSLVWHPSYDKLEFEAGENIQFLLRLCSNNLTAPFYYNKWAVGQEIDESDWKRVPGETFGGFPKWTYIGDGDSVGRVEIELQATGAGKYWIYGQTDDIASGCDMTFYTDGDEFDTVKDEWFPTKKIYSCKYDITSQRYLGLMWYCGSSSGDFTEGRYNMAFGGEVDVFGNDGSDRVYSSNLIPIFNNWKDSATILVRTGESVIMPCSPSFFPDVAFPDDNSSVTLSGGGLGVIGVFDCCTNVEYCKIEPGLVSFTLKTPKGYSRSISAEYVGPEVICDSAENFEFNQIISLATSDENANIFYTLNGSEPDEHAEKYTEPFQIKDSLILKAIAVLPSGGRGNVLSKSFTRTKTLSDVIGMPDLRLHQEDESQWEEDAEMKFYNFKSLRSGAINNLGQSSISLDFTVENASVIKFHWKASCEDDPDFDDFDFGAFELNGEEVRRIDGWTDWEEVRIELQPGTYHARWIYHKDESDDPSLVGDDCIWVAKLEIGNPAKVVFDDGMSVFETETLTGCVPIVPDAPQREHICFVGWDKDVTLPIYSNTVFKAQWEYIVHEASFVIDEYCQITGGGELTQIVEHGYCAQAPVINPGIGRKFLGWDGDVSAPIISNAVFTAKIEYDGIAGKNGSLAWVIANETGELTFYGAGSIPYEAYKSWEKYADKIKRIVIPETITSIGVGAFKNLSHVTDVVVAKSVKSIGEGAFSGCSSVTSMTLPFIGSKRGSERRYCEETLLGYIFGSSSYVGASATSQYYSSGSWETYYIPDSLKTVTITDETIIGCGAFYNCRYLEDVTIPNSVEKIDEGAFCGCWGLGNGVVSRNGCILTVNGVCPADVIIPSNVRIIAGSAFRSCTGLRSISVPSNVVTIGSAAFQGCSNVTNMVLPFVGARRGNSGSPEAVFGYIFGETAYTGGTRVEQRYETSWSSSYHTSAYYYIPDSLRSVEITDEPEIGSGAFHGCSRIVSVSIPLRTVNIRAHAFSSCLGLKSIQLSPCLERIGEYAFSKCKVLSELIMPPSVTHIDGYAFDACAGISRVCVGDLSSWCKIVFANGSSNPLSYTGTLSCNGEDVLNLELPDTVRTIGSYAFYGCSRLQSVKIPTTVWKIGDRAFSGCGVDDVTIPSSVTQLGVGVFTACKSLKSIEIPSSVLSVGGEFCKECNALESVVIKSKIKSVGEYMFSGCRKLKTIELPESIESIGDWAFAYCDALTNPIIPSTIKKVGRYAFYACSALSAITIPSAVTEIGNYAFYSCDLLGLVYVDKGDVERVKALYAWPKNVTFLETVGIEVAGDPAAKIVNTENGGCLIKPSDGNVNVELNISEEMDRSMVIVEVATSVRTVKPDGAKVKVVVGDNDITDYLVIPESDGVLNIAAATVKEEIVKETLDPSKDAVIELNAANPQLITAPTRKGLFYQLQEGVTLGGMKDGDSTIGDGNPWSPKITVKGGNSAFYSIGVGKGE